MECYTLFDLMNAHYLFSLIDDKICIVCALSYLSKLDLEPSKSAIIIKGSFIYNVSIYFFAIFVLNWYLPSMNPVINPRLMR